MKYSDLITIIIPNYNNEIFLDECLNSILNQTYKNLEILIIDDCSTDNSLKILEKYQEQYPQVRVLKNEKNLGVTKTRIKAINHAKGKYLTTLDPDDYYISNLKLEKELELIKKFKNEQNKEILACSDYHRVNAKGEFIYSFKDQKGFNGGNILETVFMRTKMVPRDYLFTKEQYQKIGGYDSNLPIYEDFDLNMRFAAAYEFYATSCVGTAYRDTGAGLSNAKKKMHNKWIFYVFKKNLPLLGLKKYPIVTFLLVRLIYRKLRTIAGDILRFLVLKK